MAPRIIKFTLAVLFLIATNYASLLIGTYGTLARGAFINSIAIHQEEKCWLEKDIDCFRASWQLRAAIVANTAKDSLDSHVPSEISKDLEEYLEWYKTVKTP